MAKAVALEDQLAQLKSLRAASTRSPADLAKLLDSKHSVIVAGAAPLVAEDRLVELIPALIKAFDRFLANGDKNDKGCAAKFAIVNALCALNHREPETYLAGLRCVQLEPGFGGSSDTAGELRGRCAIALAEMAHPSIVIDIAPLLADKDGQTRVGAARALGVIASEGAAGTLRLKLLLGDEEPAVLTECAAALLAISARDHAAFVISALQAAKKDDVIEAILVALGECRDSAIVEPLKQMYAAARIEPDRRAALRILARLRVDGAHEALLDIIEKALHIHAKEAVEAAAPLRNDPRFMQKLDAALDRRDDKFLTRHRDEVFTRNHR